MYSLFTLAPLLNLPLGILKMLKKCMVSYRSSENMLKNVSERGAKPKPLERIRNATLLGCNVLLSAFDTDSVTAVVEAYFSKGDGSYEFNGLSRITEVRGNLVLRNWSLRTWFSCFLLCLLIWIRAFFSNNRSKYNVQEACEKTDKRL